MEVWVHWVGKTHLCPCRMHLAGLVSSTGQGRVETWQLPPWTVFQTEGSKAGCGLPTRTLVIHEKIAKPPMDFPLLCPSSP